MDGWCATEMIANKLAVYLHSLAIVVGDWRQTVCEIQSADERTHMRCVVDVVEEQQHQSYMTLFRDRDSSFTRDV